MFKDSAKYNKSIFVSGSIILLNLQQQQKVKINMNIKFGVKLFPT